MDRRQFLALAGTSSTCLSGCLGGGLAEDALVKVVPESAPESDVDVHYKNLPPAEQEIVETAVEEPYYHVCPDFRTPSARSPSGSVVSGRTSSTRTRRTPSGFG